MFDESAPRHRRRLHGIPEDRSGHGTVSSRPIRPSRTRAHPASSFAGNNCVGTASTVTPSAGVLRRSRPLRRDGRFRRGVRHVDPRGALVRFRLPARALVRYSVHGTRLSTNYRRHDQGLERVSSQKIASFFAAYPLDLSRRYRRPRSAPLLRGETRRAAQRLFSAPFGLRRPRSRTISISALSLVAARKGPSCVAVRRYRAAEVVSAPTLAVLGCGYWGQNLVRNFAALGALRSSAIRRRGARQRARASRPASRPATPSRRLSTAMSMPSSSRRRPRRTIR